MSDKPVWMETWHCVRDTARDVGKPHFVVLVERSGVTDRKTLRLRTTLDSDDNEAAARLAAAAPALVRALLRNEWQGREYHTCPDCLGRKRTHPALQGERHRDGCFIDAALKLAGFHDQAARDAARERMRGDGR